MNSGADEDGVEPHPRRAQHVGLQAVADCKHRVARRIAGQTERMVVDRAVRLAVPGDRTAELLIKIGKGAGAQLRDAAVHERVCAEAKDWVESQGWTVLGITQSPITGPEGNVEFLLGAEKNG